MKLIFYIFLFYNFYSFISIKPNISFLNNQFVQDFVAFDDIWYEKFLKQTKSPILTGKNTKIVIFDTGAHRINTICNKWSKNGLNLQQDKRCSFFDQVVDDNEKDLSCETKKKHFFQTSLKISHADCTISIIQSIAPDSIITLMPTLDKRGFATKEAVLQGLKSALKENPDILHLGFQIFDFDMTQKVDKQIFSILKKFKCVIMPAGNNNEINKLPLSNQRTFLVGSFKKEGGQYLISGFCPKNQKSDFVMPGENITIKVPNTQGKKIILTNQNGTSWSAAFLTGFTALLFEQNKKKYIQNSGKIRKDLIKYSTFLDKNWKRRTRHGFPHF